jgi:ubiquinone/menaquinone biosynthesis C-methylase UbiE
MEKAVYRLLFEVEDNYWWQKGRHLIARQLLEMDKTLARGSSKILDAGCGTGGWLKVLKDDFWVTGLDISKEALHFCAERKLDRLVNGDVASLPYKDNTFDLITSFDVLYHKDVSSELATLKEFLRVLKPNGRIFLNSFNHQLLLQVSLLD